MSENISMEFPAGRYWIGDLCYVIRDEWKEFCAKVFGNHDQENVGKIELDDGTVTWFHFTAYGDGTYFDQFGNMYGVDAGLIGIIAVHDIKDHSQNYIGGGNLHTFDAPFTVNYVDSTFYFDDVRIYTG